MSKQRQAGTSSCLLAGHVTPSPTTDNHPSYCALPLHYTRHCTVHAKHLYSSELEPSKETEPHVSCREHGPDLDMPEVAQKLKHN